MPSTTQSQLIALAPSSTIFCRLEYNLQSLARASTLRIKRASELVHPMLCAAFETRAKNNPMILETWIPEHDIPGSLALEDQLLTAWMESPEDTMSFSVGPISLQDVLRPSGGSRFTGRLVLCRAAVGRSFSCHSKEDAKMLPEGYHSFFIDSTFEPECFDVNASSTSSLSSTPLTFIVKSKMLVLPQYLVEVEWDADEEKRSRKSLLCDNCEQQEAALYCPSDAAHLCASCDKDQHLSKLTSRHIRTPLEKGLHCIIRCRIHSERLAEFFCPQCHVVVCLSCKMVGHHSSGDAAEHLLVPVPEAYASTLSASSSPDPIFIKRREEICEQLQKIQIKASKLLCNAAEVRGQLRDAYEMALQQLSRQLHQKLRVLRGDEILFQRLLWTMERTAEYMAYLRSGRDAPLFLLSWHHYLQAKVAMSVVPASHSAAVAKPLNPELCPDTLLELKGSLVVVNKNTTANNVIKP